MIEKIILFAAAVVSAIVVFVFYSFEINNKIDYKIKFDRYNVQSSELTKDNLLKAIQFNIKTNKIDIDNFKEFNVSIENNNKKTTYYFFKDKNTIKYYIKSTFGKKRYIEDTWYYCDILNCSFAVQYYPEIYSGSLYDNNFKINYKNNRTDYLSINLKEAFDKSNILEKNKISMSINKNKIYIKVKKGTFKEREDAYSMVLEYQLNTKTLKDKVFIDKEKLLKDGFLNIDIGYDKNDLKYLSLFVYDNDVNYENKLVTIGK